MSDDLVKKVAVAMAMHLRSALVLTGHKNAEVPGSPAFDDAVREIEPVAHAAVVACREEIEREAYERAASITETQAAAFEAEASNLRDRDGSHDRQRRAKPTAYTLWQHAAAIRSLVGNT